MDLATTTWDRTSHREAALRTALHRGSSIRLGTRSTWNRHWSPTDNLPLCSASTRRPTNSCWRLRLMAITTACGVHAPRRSPTPASAPSPSSRSGHPPGPHEPPPIHTKQCLEPRLLVPRGTTAGRFREQARGHSSLVPRGTRTQTTRSNGAKPIVSMTCPRQFPRSTWNQHQPWRQAHPHGPDAWAAHPNRAGSIRSDGVPPSTGSTWNTRWAHGVNTTILKHCVDAPTLPAPFHVEQQQAMHARNCPFG